MAQFLPLLKRNYLNLGVILFILVLSFYNLTAYPLTWFDEGSHLHVPKTLVNYGVYADYSSDGFRYYGPTLGVGPTVMLPIAGSFLMFGVGLLQARIVIVLYMLAGLWVFYAWIKELEGRKIALAALLLLISSRSVLYLQYGRQVLGEVPGLFFFMLGLWLWFKDWEKPSLKRLSLVGLFIGLAIVTKYQFLLFIMPALGISWLLALLYYRGKNAYVFFVPALVAGVIFALWQSYMLVYLGPSTVGENFALLQKAAAGAAFKFSPQIIDANLDVLISRSAYLGVLLPALVYGFFLALPRSRDGQKWGFLIVLIGLNLLWYAVASIGWIRYAFIGLAFSSIVIARFFSDLSNGFTFPVKQTWLELTQGKIPARSALLSFVVAVWGIGMFVIPMSKTIAELFGSGHNPPVIMAQYLDENVPLDAEIETWEPELGFLTDHHYHYPPTDLLAESIEFVNFNAPPPYEFYDYLETSTPDYVILGNFSRWVQIYSDDTLAQHYTYLITVEGYDLYQRK
jgi:hypothetical protein